MRYLAVIIIGYLLGSFNLAEVFGRKKDVDLRNTGTKNLGASNTLLTMGKKLGAIVMLVDMAKAAAAVAVAALMLPNSEIAPLLGGLSSVIGHIFPFYLGFRGGKGLASFGGMILAYDLPIFLFLLVLGVTLMIIVNYSFALPMSAAILFPILAGYKTKNLAVFVIAVAASTLIIVKHSENVVKAKNKEDIEIRDFIKNKLFKKEDH